MENKKKIIHLIQALDSGGCENMLLRTLPLMNKFEHVIVVLKKRGELALEFEKIGITVININQKSLFDILAYKRLLKVVSNIKSDLIISYLFHADLIGRLFLQFNIKIKVIPFLRTTYNHVKFLPARLFECMSKGLVFNYLANSESVKDFYVNNIGVDSRKITVIPNGIDINFYDQIPRNKKLIGDLGIKSTDKVLICVANFHIYKGHKYLLEAFEEVYKTNQNIKLLLVGDGDEKENLLNQIDGYKSKKNILFLGKRSDVPTLLKISDIFVFPTLFEGMSNALMEAMTCGLPIVTTVIPENRTLLNNNSAMFVPVKNSGEIAKNIRLLLVYTKLVSRLAKNARNIILENYDLIKVAKKYEEFIRKYISKQ